MTGQGARGPGPRLIYASPDEATGLRSEGHREVLSAMTHDLSRRNALRVLAAAAPCAAGGAAAGVTDGRAPAAATNPQGVCILLPHALEGPYYFDPKQVRADITEGRPGLPLAITLRIVEAQTCTPIAGARVDVWHADASGVYSGYDGQGDTGRVSATGKTYLRGTQFTDAAGDANFRTIYPGWYPGRTPHIHLKVLLDERSVLTGQAYFPDDVSARIYREHAPYTDRPVADTSNDRDFIFKSGEREGGGIVMAMGGTTGAMTASLVVAVDRTGEAARKARGRRS